MSRSSLRLTRGRSRTPRTRLNITALAPIPRARVRTTVAVRPLACHRERAPTFSSRRNETMLSIMRVPLFEAKLCKSIAYSYGATNKGRGFRARSGQCPISGFPRLGTGQNAVRLLGQPPRSPQPVAEHARVVGRLAGAELLHRVAHLVPPVGMLRGGGRQVLLLGFLQQILEADHHHARGRAGQPAYQRVVQLARQVGNLAGVARKPIRQQPFVEERVQQLLLVVTPLGQRVAVAVLIEQPRRAPRLDVPPDPVAG